MIPGLGLGLLLLCGSSIAQKMSYAHLRKENLLTCITVRTLQDTLIFIWSLWSSTSAVHTRLSWGCVRLYGQQRKVWYIMVSYGTTMISAPSQQVWSSTSSVMQVSRIIPVLFGQSSSSLQKSLTMGRSIVLTPYINHYGQLNLLMVL